MDKVFQISHGMMKIQCRLSEPALPVRRVVLGVHGLAGSSQDEIQVGLAEEMPLFGCAVLRFDFPSHGESPVTDKDLNLKGCIASLLAVAGFAREKYPEVEDLCIFATGFGAYVTLLALDQLLDMGGNVKLVVQTPSVRMHETLLAMLQLTPERFYLLERMTIPIARPFDVTYRFYEELRDHTAMNEYPIPMLILRGEEDDYIPMSDIQLFRRINDRSRLVIIPGTSHRFQEDGAWDMVLDLTRDWFEFEQVLLVDWI